MKHLADGDRVRQPDTRLREYLRIDRAVTSPRRQLAMMRARKGERSAVTLREFLRIERGDLH